MHNHSHMNNSAGFEHLLFRDYGFRARGLWPRPGMTG
jgi:hypothetical protein